MKQNEIITQILFRKYSNEYSWLTYSDLSKLVHKFCTNPITYTDKDKHIDINTVLKYHAQIFPFIQKIHRVKSMRSLDEQKQDLEKSYELPLTHTHINTDIFPISTYKTHTIFIDSKDRNTQYWNTNNPFQFPLGSASITGQDSTQPNSINRSFSNIHSVSIKQIIIPDYTVYYSTQYPYLLLKIEEFGSNLNGTNDIITNSFGYLSQPSTSSTINNYLYYNYSETMDVVTNYNFQSTMTKIFSPRIDLSKITISILNPEGTLIKFQSAESIIIELQITCFRKDLDNNIINNPA
tara:strand:+ start:8333 stop:9214 length:882 start_codon:yes stop_codon:yes gene_type:complete